MANRFPLIIDTDDGNKIKELPNGDNLNLLGSAIVNASSVATNGAITCNSITINGQSLSNLAFSADWDDIVGKPSFFSGAYADLSGKPSIPTLTTQLNDVSSTLPTDGQGLIYNSLTARYEPVDIQTSFDIGTHSIQELNNVVVAGDATNKWLKYYSGAWRPTTIQYSDVNNTPTSLSQFVNDMGFLATSELGTTQTIPVSIIGDVYGEDSTLLVDHVNSNVPASAIGGTLKNSTVSEANVTQHEAALTITESQISDFGSYVSAAGGVAAIDIKGSVFADDSSIIVDGVNGKIVGPIETTNLGIGTDNEIREYLVGPDKNILIDGVGVYSTLTGTFDVDAAGAIQIQSTGSTTTVDGRTGLNLVSGINPSYATATLYASDFDVNSNTTFYGNVEINSGNYFKLPVLTAAPASPVIGMMVVADGATWNPVGTGNNEVVVYLQKGPSPQWYAL